MVSKILITTIFLFNLSYASFELVKVGTIDRYYQSKISKDNLKAIILEVEQDLESQLQTDIFDYSSNGKPINLLYIAPSLLEKRIDRKLQRLKSKQQKINQLQEYFPKNQKLINRKKELFKKENDFLNKRVREFNSYVKDINKRKSMTKKEYSELKSYINTRKKVLDKEIKKMDRYRNSITSEVNKFNTKVHLFNAQIREYKRLSQEIETLSRGFKKVKGMTFGVKEIKTKTYYKNGKKVQEQTRNHRMDKIEIYGFDSISELKAIIAHEIMHLVGIPHINSKYSLMNPIMQKNQIQSLNLTNEDIKNFRANF